MFMHDIRVLHYILLILRFNFMDIITKKHEVVPRELLSKEFLSQFKTESDVSRFLKELHSQVLEQLLEGEMDAHLGYEKHSASGNNSGNSRNGSFPKKIQTEHGESIPRDRLSELSPVVVPKHESRGLSIEKLVISLYAKDMSVSDIEDELRDIYEINLSSSSISIITGKVTQAAFDWQNRPLERLYMVVWMDGIVFKVRESGKVINKTVYLCVGLNPKGYKEVLGMWLGKTESSSFWMSVLTDLKSRGVEDILITVTDNLNGFTDTIKAVFPQSYA
jgi:transposase-like protein